LESFENAQLRLRFGARYAWSFRDQPLSQIAFTPFIDVRDADANNFDYTEVGARLQARYKLGDDFNLIGRARLYARNYEDDFSDVFPEPREDRRVTVEAELRKGFGEGRVVFGAIGWDDNRSNIAVRDFDGVTFRAGFEFTLP